MRIALLVSNIATITDQCPESPCKYREMLAWIMAPLAKASVAGRYKISYGDQGVLCHATSPHGLVPPIKRPRIPSHLVIEGDGVYSNYSVFLLILSRCAILKK